MPIIAKIGGASLGSFGYAGGIGAPVNTVAPVVTGTTIVGNTLSTTNGTWVNSPTSYTYQWQRNGTTNIGGATSSTYVLTTSDIGFTINCRVTATNSVGSSSASSNSTAAITSPPVNTVAPVVSGTPTQGQTLSTTNGTWSYSPTSYAYQWQRNNTTNIGGATSSTYLLTLSDVGSTINCRVTASNASGSNTANSNSTAAVAGLTYTASYLLVGGGGGGGNSGNFGGPEVPGGGGGAGGVLSGSATLTQGTTYYFGIGGGAGPTGTGGNTTGLGLTAYGGGYGGTGNPGGDGGSGGGGTGIYAFNGGYAIYGSQGTNGGSNQAYPSEDSGGGGGAGTAGGNVAPGGGIGGDGVISSITGSSVYYGGGGGGIVGTSGSNGGAGGGGRGGDPGQNGSNGTNGLGGGGGGAGGYGSPTQGGYGGTGVAILSVPSAKYTGAYTGSVTVTTSGGNVILKFNSGVCSYTA